MPEHRGKEKRRAAAGQVAGYARALLKWLFLAVIVGAAGGVVGALFHLGVERAAALRGAHPWLLWLLPLAGVAITAMYRLAHVAGLGTNTVLDSVHEGRSIPWLLLPAIFFSTILTHLCGGSAGREGAALQMGGDLGRHVGELLRLDDKDRRLATLCGMSALFSALFGTPLTATVFALEVVSVGVLYYAGFLPCIVASLVAYGVSLLFGLAPTRFSLTVPAVDAPLLLRTAVLAVLCALVSILLCETLHRTEHLAARLLPNPYFRALVGGLLIAAATVLLGTTDYNGAGLEVVAKAVEQGQARPWDFLCKLLFTAVTLGCGFKGGEMVPTFFVGATFGCAAAPLLGLPGGFGAAIGLAAVFCGAVNCPIAAILLSVELFGSEGLSCFALACGVGYMLSGYRGLYSSQTILYSKLKAEFINIHAK
ncbi:MAG: chloride channel protein [Oscillospiraceae bacterium]